MEEPIRVLQVFHCMDCGGAENMIMNLYREIDRSKVQFDFLVHSTKKSYFDEEIKALGGRIFCMPYFKVINTYAYKKALRTFFEAHPEIKIVHGHVGSCSHIYLKIAKRYGCFTIAHSHSTKPKASLKSLAFRLFTFETRRVAQYFMSCGQLAGDYRFGKRITADTARYQILPNAINLDKYAFNLEMRLSMRQEFGYAKGPVFGHIGRFNYPKNHDFLIDIFQEIHQRTPEARLLLVGEGELRGEIEEKVLRLGLQKAVHFTGLRQDIPRLLMGMDVLLFPSHYEGLPVTLVEAQASGLPCFISDVITKEIHCTSLVEAHSLKENAASWAERAIEIANKEIDREAKEPAEQIRKAGYDIKESAKELSAFYISVKDAPSS